jgi:hypothetical protein
VLASHALAKTFIPNTKKPFEKGDNSPEPRLNTLYNSLKHYDVNFLEGQIPPGPSAPVWIVNDGLKCAVGIKGEIALTFAEMVSLFNDLEVNAKYLAEDVYQLAALKSAANLGTHG